MDIDTDLEQTLQAEYYETIRGLTKELDLSQMTKMAKICVNYDSIRRRNLKSAPDDALVPVDTVEKFVRHVTFAQTLMPDGGRINSRQALCTMAARAWAK